LGNVFASLRGNIAIGGWVGSCPTLSSKTVVFSNNHLLFIKQNI